MSPCYFGSCDKAFKNRNKRDIGANVLRKKIVKLRDFTLNGAAKLFFKKRVVSRRSFKRKGINFKGQLLMLH